MEPKIPVWLRWVIQKFEFFAVPNLGTLLAGLAVIGFAANVISPIPIERLVFSPILVLQGEWWRLFTFPFVSATASHPFFFIFYVLFLYFVLNSLEERWGPGPLTVYLGLGYLAVLGGAFITLAPVDINTYLVENLSLAFGTLFPEFTLSLYFIFPVKAKWLALIAGFFILLKFIQLSWMGKLALVLAFSPYLLFFGGYLVRVLINQRKSRQHKKRFDDEMWR